MVLKKDSSLFHHHPFLEIFKVSIYPCIISEHLINIIDSTGKPFCILFYSWFKVAVSTIDSKDPKTYWSRCIGLISADTQLKMKKLKKNMKYYINYKILYYLIENICNLVNQELIK